ncbi:hypothetical protein DV20_12980 [Amycolatopsis rifamycinica]|uniref:Uncharacterized protein n=1 Tax=Amycolatopsis rifamycinica TaxID=287986 RepID=A0A066UCI1_9PSEU|nr:hypothetical protein DV20_12980 [Amycolatopsis rifamycinica]
MVPGWPSADAFGRARASCSWLILAVGVAYAGVRLRPRVGDALLVGFGVGVLIIALATGMQMLA